MSQEPFNLRDGSPVENVIADSNKRLAAWQEKYDLRIAALEAENLSKIEDLSRFETALTATRELLTAAEQERDRLRAEVDSINTRHANLAENCTRWKHRAIKAEVERDELRKALEEWVSADPIRNEREFQQRDEIKRLHSECDALRNAIEEAPHDQWCWGSDVTHCDCWKSAALANQADAPKSEAPPAPTSTEQ